MTRRPLSTKARVELFRVTGGICHICAGKIQVGQAWEVEHVIPLAQGGEDGGDNLRPAHVACHRVKTSQDATDTAKAKRREARHLGIKRSTSRPLPGSKASGLRKRMDGTVSRRGHSND